MSGKNNGLTGIGSSASKPDLLESWDSQYNIVGSSLQNQIVGSLHLVSGLTSCSRGASSNVKHHKLMSATSKLYATGSDAVLQQAPASTAVLSDPLNPRKPGTWRRDRSHEVERSQSYESSDTDMEFRQDVGTTEAAAAALLLDGQWDCETNSVSVAGIWGPTKRAKTQQQYDQLTSIFQPLVVTGYINFETVKDHGRANHIGIDDVANPKVVHSHHNQVIAASEKWSGKGFGAELHDLHIPETQQHNNRKRQLELDFIYEESTLSGHLDRSRFEGLQGSCKDQHLIAREAYEEFRHDQIDESFSNKRVVKRSSKGGPRRPNIIKGQWTIEEDRYAQLLSRATQLIIYLWISFSCLLCRFNTLN